MKKPNGKRIVRGSMVVLLILLSCSIAWADFYVVASGKRAKKTILVSPKSTETASGAALLNAVSGINDSGETNPYLIIIEPGVYDIGTNYLQMRDYVDIQGSGEKVTKITGTIGNPSNGVLQGNDNAELRFLTVENTSTGSYNRAIYNYNESPKITNVTAISSGGADCVGILNVFSSPIITNVTAIASGTTVSAGVTNSSSSPTMMNVTATASGGSNASVGVNNLLSSSPAMTNVTAGATNSGGSYSIGINNADTSSPVIMDVIANATNSGSGDSLGVLIKDSASPTMMNVTATASGGTNSVGVNIRDSATSTITNVTAKASGGSTNSLGFNNKGTSSTKMTNVTAVALTGGTYSIGINTIESAFTSMMNVTTTASGGGGNIGVYHGGSSYSTINNSVLSGDTTGLSLGGTSHSTINSSVLSGPTQTFFNMSTGETTYIGNSCLDGSSIAFGIDAKNKCVGVHDENFTVLDTDCTSL